MHTLPPNHHTHTHTHTRHAPPPKAVSEAIQSMDAAVFSSAEDVATVVQCLPSEDERGLLEVRGAAGGSL